MSLVTAHSGDMFWVDTANGCDILDNDSRIDWFILKDVRNTGSKFRCDCRIIGSPYFIIGRQRGGSIDQLAGYTELFIAFEVTTAVEPGATSNTDIVTWSGLSGSALIYRSGATASYLINTVTGGNYPNGTSLGTGTSFQVRYKAATGACNGILQIYVDGVEKINTWHAQTDTIDMIQFASNPAAGKATAFGMFDFSNIWINDTTGSVNNSWPTSITADDPLVCTALTPDGHGIVDQWASTGADRYSVVDETPPATADNISETTDGEEEALTLTTLTATARAITWHWHYYFGAGASAAVGSFGRVVNGTKYYGGTDLSARQLGDNALQCDEISPDTSTSWTQTEIDGMEILMKRVSGTGGFALLVGACRATIWVSAAGPATVNPPATMITLRAGQRRYPIVAPAVLAPIPFRPFVGLFAAAAPPATPNRRRWAAHV